MGLYRRPDSPFWWWSVTLDGRRFRGCCGSAARAEAQAVLKRERERLLATLPLRKGEITLDAACARYLVEHAHRLASAGDIRRIAETLLAELGHQVLLSRLSGDDIATMVARRRAQVSDASVNRELTILRAVMTMAARRWGMQAAAIDWKRQFLLEPAPRARILAPDEEARLFAALRPDFHALVRFALLSGLRLGNLVGLRWADISWSDRVIRLRVKSRRPGGDQHQVPLTRALAAILSAERGRHPVYVFTYIAQRARSEERRAIERQAGQRQPFSHDGWRKAWAAALTDAGLADLRFHDLRHTFATRLYRATGDLRLTQKALGHKSIATTTRYENSGLDDLRSALDALDTPRPRRKRK